MKQILQDSRTGEVKVADVPVPYGGEAPTPEVLTETAWALLRLGRADEAVERSRRGLGEAGDPMLGKRIRFAAMLALADGEAEADAVLVETLDAVARLPDRAHAAAVVAEADRRLGLLGADAAWGAAAPSIARLRARLPTDAED